MLLSRLFQSHLVSREWAYEGACSFLLAHIAGRVHCNLPPGSGRCATGGCGHAGRMSSSGIVSIIACCIL